MWFLKGTLLLITVNISSIETTGIALIENLILNTFSNFSFPFNELYEVTDKLNKTEEY